MQKRFGYQSLFLLASLLMVCYLMVRSGSGWAGDQPATLVVAIPAYVDSFDPTNHRSRLTQVVLKNVYESLTSRDAGVEGQPLLARQWESLDPLTWRFGLKRGVRFHDGREFSSRDVKFTLDRVTRPGGLEGRDSPRKELFKPIEAIETPDALTVLIRTGRPWPILPMMLSLQEIMPDGSAPDREGAAPGFSMAGTGPFKLVEATAGQEIVLERFDEYHSPQPLGSVSGAVPVERLIFRVIPRKVDQIAGLKAGDVDLMFGVPPSAAGILAAIPGIHLVSRPATRSYFAEINCLKPPFDDRGIRQALNHAVDMADLVEHVLGGHGVVLSTVLLPNAFGFNDQLPVYRHDLRRAEQLLTAGRYPANRPVVVFSNEEDREAANIIALFLTKAGLRVKVQVQEQYRPTETGRWAEWDIFVGSWGNSTLDPMDILVPKFKCGGHGNFSGYCNEKVDELLGDAERAADLDIRGARYREVQQLIHDDAPMIFGYAPEELYGLRDRIKNFDPPPSGMFQFGEVRVEPGGRP